MITKSQAAGQSAFNACFQGGFVSLGGHRLALGVFEDRDFEEARAVFEYSGPVSIVL